MVKSEMLSEREFSTRRKGRFAQERHANCCRHDTLNLETSGIEQKPDDNSKAIPAIPPGDGESCQFSCPLLLPTGAEQGPHRETHAMRRVFHADGAPGMKRGCGASSAF